MIAVSTIGGIVGLISGLLVFYDRYYKGRPVVSVTVEKPGGDRKLVCIRIKNTTAYDVAILGARNRQDTYFLTEEDNMRAIVEGAMGKTDFAFMLKPDESKEMVIRPKYKDNVALEVTRPGYVDFAIYWRRGNATWLPQIPLLVCSTTHVLRKLGGVE